MIKKLLFSILVFCVAVAGQAYAEETPATDGTGPVFVLDQKGSYLTWTGRKVTGSHNGRLWLKKAEIEISEEGRLLSASIDVDMSSLVVDDLKDPDDNGKLTRHLKAGDFFAVELNPIASLKTTSVQFMGGGADQPNYVIKADMTIMGKTNPVEFVAKVDIGDSRAVATGKLELDRTRWGIHYGSGKFFKSLGDKLIYDNFDLEFVIKGDLKK